MLPEARRGGGAQHWETKGPSEQRYTSWPGQVAATGRKPFPHSVASSGVKDTPMHRVFLVPPKVLIESYPGHSRRLCPKSLPATYPAAGGFKPYILRCSRGLQIPGSKQRPSASRSVPGLWPLTPTFPREQVPEQREGGGPSSGRSPRR